MYYFDFNETDVLSEFFRLYVESLAKITASQLFTKWQNEPLGRLCEVEYRSLGAF